MPESPPKLPTQGKAKTLPNAFRAAWFGGMIQGQRGNDDALASAVAHLNQLQLARVELEFDGRHFNALIDDRPLRAGAWKTDRLQDFVQGLQALVDATGAPSAVESNMRCVELYGDRAVETLFAVISGQVLCRSQERGPRPSDEELLASFEGPLELKRMGPLKKLGLAVLVLLVSLVVSMQIGLDDLVFARDAELLRRDNGAFGELLSMEVAPVFGGYRVDIGRGPAYLESQASMLELAKSTEPLTRQAASLRVGSGGEVFVRVLDEQGLVLATGSVFLDGLLNQSDARVSITLPAFRRAIGLELSTNRGNVGH